MKKLFTLFVAVVVAMTTFAAPLQMTPGKKQGQVKEQKNEVVEKLMSVKELKRVALPEKSMKKAPAIAEKVAPATKLASELISLNFDEISAGPTYSESSGDWWIGLGCYDESRPEYGHVIYLDWFAPADNMCGTFTTKDFDLSYCYMYTNYCMGAIMFDSITMTIAENKIGECLEVLTIDAILYGTDGFSEYGFQVHVEEKTITPKNEIAVSIPTATLTEGEEGFTMAGSNDDANIIAIVNNPWGITGTYTELEEGSKIAYKGSDITPIQLNFAVSVKNIADQGLAYVGTLNVLSIDTIAYNFELIAPMPAPTDTVEIICTNLELDDSWVSISGTVDFYASNEVYEISGYWYAEWLEPGTYTLAEASMSLFNNIDYSSISALALTLDVYQDENYDYAIKASMLGDDNVMYNLDLKWEIPTPTDTVVVAFDTPAKARFYPDMDNDLMLFNENDKYYAALDVFGTELGGSFTDDNMDMWFTRLNIKNGEDEEPTTVEIAAVKNGLLTQVGDTTKLEAELYTFEGILYQVSLWYVAVTPTEVVDVTYENAQFINNMEDGGAYSLLAYAPDSLTVMVITVYANSIDEVAGTFVNDGKFGGFGEGQYDFDGSNTYFGVWNEEAEEYTLIYSQKGNITVTLDEEKNIVLTGEMLFENAIQYNVTMKSKIVKPRIEYDAEEGAIDRQYTVEDPVVIYDYTEDYGMIFFQVMSMDKMDLIQLYFMTAESDADIIIPTGTYAINSSWEYGTVLAGAGVDWDGSVAPSFYATFNETGALEAPLYFMVEGTVEVSKNNDGKLHLEVNALNSYDVPVHIVYDASGTGLEDIAVEDVVGVKKMIIDGQMVIIRNGEAFNATGARVK